jgi:hypothetical protein
MQEIFTPKLSDVVQEGLGMAWSSRVCSWLFPVEASFRFRRFYRRGTSDRDLAFLAFLPTRYRFHYAECRITSK